MSECKHESFACEVDVQRIEDVGRFMVDVRVKCDQCGLPFCFVGLPCGLDMNSAAVSANGEEARLAIVPRGEALTPMDGLATGFSIRPRR